MVIGLNPSLYSQRLGHLSSKRFRERSLRLGSQTNEPHACWQQPDPVEGSGPPWHDRDPNTALLSVHPCRVSFTKMAVTPAAEPPIFSLTDVAFRPLAFTLVSLKVAGGTVNRVNRASGPSLPQGLLETCSMM